jgi:hypothetical protein
MLVPVKELSDAIVATVVGLEVVEAEMADLKIAAVVEVSEGADLSEEINVDVVVETEVMTVAV